MNIKRLYLFTLLLPVQLMAQYNWQVLPNAPKSWRCDDVYFINPQIGWAVHAYYNDAYPNQYGQVYKTRDGGNTWQLMKDSSKTQYRCAGFVDSLTGWIGNLADKTRTTDTIPFYYTNDGGKTLTPVVLPLPRPKGICGISVATDSVIYAYGRWSGPTVLAKTIDRGKTWTTYDMSSYASVGLVDGWFWSKDTGFITGQNGNNAILLHTNDGGTTWQTVYQSSHNDTDHIWKIFFPSRNVGYGSIEYTGNNFYNLKPYVTYYIKTTDGGKTWTEYPFLKSYDQEGIGFINDTIGWMGGDYCQPNYITFDGGNTWSPDNGFGVPTPPYVNCTSGYNINRFRKINDTLMYASGNTVYKLSGKITGVNQITIPKYSVDNYPNPYTNQTTIEYTISQTCHNTKLEVFNETGQLILLQDLDAQNPGKHEYVFKQGLPTGAYYYSIVSDEFTITKRMVRIK